MADEADRAQAREERLREEAIARVRRHAGLRPGSRPGEAGPERCADCGAKIPEARRLAVPGTVTCVACQALRERR